MGQIFAAKSNLIQIKKIENGDVGQIGSGMTDAEANTLQLEAQVKALAARGRVGPISIQELLNPGVKV